MLFMDTYVSVCAVRAYLCARAHMCTPVSMCVYVRVWGCVCTQPIQLVWGVIFFLAKMKLFPMGWEYGHAADA